MNNLNDFLLDNFEVLKMFYRVISKNRVESMYFGISKISPKIKTLGEILSTRCYHS